MRVPKPPKSTLGRMMEEEERMSRAAGCPPGHTYNPVIDKCLPGSPLSGIGVAYEQAPVNQTTEIPDMGQNQAAPPSGGKKKANLAVKIAAERQSRSGSVESA